MVLKLVAPSNLGLIEERTLCNESKPQKQYGIGDPNFLRNSWPRIILAHSNERYYSKVNEERSEKIVLDMLQDEASGHVLKQ